MVDFRIITVVIAGLIAGPTSAMTFANERLYRSSLAAKAYPGVGGLGDTSGRDIVQQRCTGALVASNVVMTAAHCIHIANIGFFLPTVADAAAHGHVKRVYRVTSSMVVKNYRGTGGDTDLALLTLGQPVRGVKPYALYTRHDEIGKIVTMVGAGLSGLTSEGARYVFTDLRLRAGVNRYEITRTRLIDYFSKRYGGEKEPADDVLLMDVDNGKPENDAFGRYMGIHDLGVRRRGAPVDAGLAYVDSGGPDFIDGKIAGVHSFAGSGSFLEQADGKGCVPGSVDPVTGNRWGCSDGSYGDIQGSVRVSYYVDAIRAYIAAAKPQISPGP